MSYQMEIEDAQGRRRTEGFGYKAKDGERVMSVRVPHMMMDDAPGQVFMRDSASHQLGDAIATDKLDGADRIRFADGTSAVKNSGRWIYFMANGQAGGTLSRDQQAHMMREASGHHELGAQLAREHLGDAAHRQMVDQLRNGWRSDAKGAVPLADAAAAHADMCRDLSNAWQN